MIPVLVRVVRILLVLFVIRLAFRLWADWRRSRAGRPAEPARPAAPAGELVRDRICNTFLPRDRALVAVVAGREEHFCSAACRDAALAGRGLDSRPPVAQSQGLR